MATKMASKIGKKAQALALPSAELAASDKKMLTQASKIAVTDAATCKRAKAAFHQIRTRRKALKTVWDGICSSFSAAHKKATALRALALDPFEKAEEWLESDVLAFEEREEAKARSLQVQLQASSELVAQQERLSEVEHLVEQGRTEEAEDLKSQPVAVATVMVPVADTKVEGVGGNSTWSAEVFNLPALIAQVFRMEAPIECLLPNMPFLNRQAGAFKSTMPYAGVRAKEEKSLSAR